MQENRLNAFHKGRPRDCRKLDPGRGDRSPEKRSSKGRSAVTGELTASSREGEIQKKKGL